MESQLIDVFRIDPQYIPDDMELSPFKVLEPPEILSKSSKHPICSDLSSPSSHASNRRGCRS